MRGFLRQSLKNSVSLTAMLFVFWAAAAGRGGQGAVLGQAAALPVPGFHHLHLNSTNPDAAIDFYSKEFRTTSKATWGGIPALKSPNNVLVLFTKMDQPPSTQPQTAVWHFGWHVPSERQAFEKFKKDGITLLPLYTTDEGGTVAINSDTWPGTGGVLGLTRPQIAEARVNGTKPVGGAGFGYIRGPDDAMVEVQGDMPAERFNHVHMYQEDPFCAALWYQTHLNAPAGGRRGGPQYTEANCKVPRGADKTWPALDVEGMYRSPSAGVTFGDVAMNWYMRQGDHPLVSTRGHLADHIALSVSNLDAWVTKLRGEGVKFLQEPYKLGETRAMMIDGPSHEALELVEVK
jgi:catechol 2,3-dioxygenase-like lactoylglutathione lyase family enzyme